MSDREDYPEYSDRGDPVPPPSLPPEVDEQGGIFLGAYWMNEEHTEVGYAFRIDGDIQVDILPDLFPDVGEIQGLIEDVLSLDESDFQYLVSSDDLDASELRVPFPSLGDALAWADGYAGILGVVLINDTWWGVEVYEDN